MSGARAAVTDSSCCWTGGGGGGFSCRRRGGNRSREAKVLPHRWQVDSAAPLRFRLLMRAWRCSGVSLARRLRSASFLCFLLAIRCSSVSVMRNVTFHLVAFAASILSLVSRSLPLCVYGLLHCEPLYVFCVLPPIQSGAFHVQWHCEPLGAFDVLLLFHGFTFRTTAASNWFSVRLGRFLGVFLSF